MSSDALHIIATLVPQAGKLDDLVREFKKLAQFVQENEPDTLMYYAVQPKSNDHIIVVEKYANADALKAHGQSEAFKEFGKSVRGLLQAAPDIKTSGFAAGFGDRSKI